MRYMRLQSRPALAIPRALGLHQGNEDRAMMRLATLGAVLLGLAACAAPPPPTEAEVLTVACSAGINEACGYLSRGMSVSGRPL